jgi:hypothetical protein
VTATLIPECLKNLWNKNPNNHYFHRSCETYTRLSARQMKRKFVMELLKLEVELCLHVFWRNSLRCLPQFISIQPAIFGVVTNMMCLESPSQASFFGT